MNDLIQIEKMNIGGAETNSVNARNIHEFLEIKTAFTTWFNRTCEKYYFVAGDDFISYLKESNGGRPMREHIVTLDMAKELCMIEPNQKGKETRKYFISIEKQSQKVLTITEQIQLIAQGHHEIEDRVYRLENNTRLTNQQEVMLTQAKNNIVYHIAKDDKVFATKLHRKVWSLFKKKFCLPRYNELPNGQFQEGLDYINNLSLSDMVD